MITAITRPHRSNGSRHWRYEKRPDGWYLTGLPRECYPDGEAGPRATKPEIRELKLGLIAFLRITAKEPKR
jgi:hypothetical protein